MTDELYPLPVENYIDDDGLWAEKQGPYSAEQVRELIAAAVAAAVPKWQPIETAPKDGTVLLSDGGTVGEGFWHDGSKCRGHRGGEGWFWETDRCELLIASNAHATHWMPLPSPPEVPR